MKFAFEFISPCGYEFLLPDNFCQSTLRAAEDLVRHGPPVDTEKLQAFADKLQCPAKDCGETHVQPTGKAYRLTEYSREIADACGHRGKE